MDDCHRQSGQSPACRADSGAHREGGRCGHSSSRRIPGSDGKRAGAVGFGRAGVDPYGADR
ncbi:MAG: hypothetical protein C4293_16865 [Nitrospiraceae bacterium]